MPEPQEMPGGPGPTEPPQEIPPSTPGQPTEPPQESPPGNPMPDIPPPIREPGEPQRPEELPGRTPDEVPVRGPQGPRSPNPATDAGLEDGPGTAPDVLPGSTEPPLSM